MNNIVTRFAPSPSGYLHLGHAASAAKAFGFAQEHAGTCLLRIEDIDTTRCKPEFEQAIYEDLTWLGYTWPQPVRRQTDHMDAYTHVIEKLRGMGLVYRCFKTRTELAAEGARPILDKSQEQDWVASGKAFAWRLSLDRAQKYLGEKYNQLIFLDHGKPVRVNPALLGDVILARKDIGTSYHVACCHDDYAQGITDIVRGVDLLESTHIHRLLQELLDWPVPHYHHHTLLVGADGKRLSKSKKSRAIRAMRQSGATPDIILAQAGQLG